jgi:hypothetical protein
MRSSVRDGLFGLRELGTIACGALALSAVLPDTARAYCRTTTCRDCERDPVTGCITEGTPIAWPNACISFSLAEAASYYADLETATRLAEQAFATWQNARCPPDDRPPSIHVANSFGPTMCAEAQYNHGEGNANIISFRETWPYQGEGNTLATTTVIFDGNGAIYDADMEINAMMPLFVDGALPKAFVVGGHDLLSIMTHEAGHFLGLDHSREPLSVMRISLESNETSTELTPHDVAAICAAYPPDRLTPACDDTPRGGFAPECAGGSLKGGAWGCNVAQSSAPPRPFTLVFLGLAALGLMWRKLRRPRFR